jgi:hypothetical protein
VKVKAMGLVPVLVPPTKDPLTVAPPTVPFTAALYVPTVVPGVSTMNTGLEEMVAENDVNKKGGCGHPGRDGFNKHKMGSGAPIIIGRDRG